MTIISNKGEKEIAARPEREELMKIPPVGTEHKTIRMGEGSRKPSKLVIYIYISYIYEIYIYI